MKLGLWMTDAIKWMTAMITRTRKTVLNVSLSAKTGLYHDQDPEHAVNGKLWREFCRLKVYVEGGKGGNLNFPLPVPCTPGSRPLPSFFLVVPVSVCLFYCKKITQCCEIYFLFLPASTSFGISFPAPSSPIFLKRPAPLLPGSGSCALPLH